MIFKSIIKIVLAKLRFGNNSITLETHSSCLLNDRQETDPMNVPSCIDTKQSDRLGFMEGEGKVPDDLTQCVPEKSKTYFECSVRLSRAFDVPTSKKQYSLWQFGEPFDKMYIILDND